jgi:hypothetical protein
MQNTMPSHGFEENNGKHPEKPMLNTPQRIHRHGDMDIMQKYAKHHGKPSICRSCSLGNHWFSISMLVTTVNSPVKASHRIVQASSRSSGGFASGFHTKPEQLPMLARTDSFTMSLEKWDSWMIHWMLGWLGKVDAEGAWDSPHPSPPATQHPDLHGNEPGSTA